MTTRGHPPEHGDNGGGADGGIDLNSAPTEALAGLRGVSARLAERIVASRPFRGLEDLLQVEGVSERLLERLRAQGAVVTHREPDGGASHVPVPVRAKVRMEGRTARGVELATYLFDEDGNALGWAPLEKGEAETALPAGIAGRMVTAVVAPVERDRAVSLERLLARGAPAVRVPVDDLKRGMDLGVVELNRKLFKKSCCRIRGVVVRKVTLPNGRVVSRPLCNARVVICEVDESPRRLITRLPDDLVVRLRDELIQIAVPRPGPFPGPDPSPLLTRVGAPVAPVSAVAEVPAATDATQATHATHTTHVANMTRATHATHLHEIAATPPVLSHAAIARRWLEANLDLLALQWCRLPWLHRDYRVDCIATVEVDDRGGFDTDIEYPCYGDRPDLYFKVEQRCDGEEWRVVHAPSVACTTRWNFCCGDQVEIDVTSTSAGLGPALAPLVHVSGVSDPAVVGAWETLPYDSQVFAVHAAVLRTGQVLLFSGGAEIGLPLQSRVWDLFTGGLASHSFPDDLFCAFQNALPDGRILVMGGSNYTGPHGRGIKATYTFDPTGAWTKHADMAVGRWYPTSVALPDGHVLVMSGRDAGGAVAALVERFDPGSNTWSTLPSSANKTLDIYPSLHVMADGRVFYTGTRWAGGNSSPRPWTPPDTALFDPATNTWSDVGPHVVPNRTEAVSVLLPPRDSAAHFHGHGEETPPPGTLTRVLVLGGDCGSPAERSSAEIVDLSEHDPAWRRLPDMHHRRVHPNAVLLPNGDVLVCAGIERFKWDPDPGGVLEAELFDSQAETWRRAAAMSTARQYHSVSVLLPDARVLNTGSVGGTGGRTNLLSMEVYSPPYLFRGPRPRITGHPTSVARGAAFTVTSPDACRVRRIVLVRPGAPTHHTDSDQRLLPLEFERQGRCRLRVEVPPEPALLPPGYYMLFVLDDYGVPSVAKFVRVT